MPLHDSSYQHWDGQHLGIWWRRAVIAGNGLKGCLQNKWMRHLITLCWAQSLAIAAILFLIGQLLVSDSVVVRWLEHLSPQLRSVGSGLIDWLVSHPEISVRTEENVLFFFFCRPLLLFSLVAIILALPHLITRDLSSRAIIIYSSKAVGRTDYLIGKFGTIFGLLCLTWLGPLCVAWLLGNLLAPNWHFFWHSRVALGNTVLFVLASMVILSVLGLGVSAMAQKEKSVVGVWLLMWLAAGSLANIPHRLTSGSSIAVSPITSTRSNTPCFVCPTISNWPRRTSRCWAACFVKFTGIRLLPGKTRSWAGRWRRPPS